MKLAAIDIGSNAIRFQVTNVIEYQGKHSFKRLEYVRFPLRLGHDVFKYGKIGPDKEDKFFRLMHAFKLLIDLYEVDDYYACATSAMRESENGHTIAKKTKQLLGLKIHIIDGDREAELINNVLVKNLSTDNYLHIDVGGGSTELNLIVNQKKKSSKSFKVGSVRTLQDKSGQDPLEQIKAWVSKRTADVEGPITAIGTGGNINKIYDLADKKGLLYLSLKKVEQVRDHIASLSIDERMHKLQLNPDRADVIIPATGIYLQAMKAAGCKKIMVPDVGLKDGLMQLLYERNLSRLELNFDTI
ncbi:MAG: phosphatase [Roseivirga sp.]|nr:phosphatase [Roseivirga sp.]